MENHRLLSAVLWLWATANICFGNVRQNGQHQCLRRGNRLVIEINWTFNMTNWTHRFYSQQRTTARNATHHPNDSSIALSLHQPLYPPGRIMHIVRHYPKADEWVNPLNNLSRLPLRSSLSAGCEISFYWFVVFSVATVAGLSLPPQLCPQIRGRGQTHPRTSSLRFTKICCANFHANAPHFLLVVAEEWRSEVQPVDCAEWNPSIAILQIVLQTIVMAEELMF